MPSNPRLTIAISTLGARAEQIALPPPDPLISYLILHQRSADVTTPLDIASRPDVVMTPLDSIGVSLSRNAGLDTAETDYLLVCDDDIALNIPGVLALMDKLDKTATLDIATGQRSGPHARRYPAQPHPLALWNIARTGAPEIMLRLASFRANKIQFDPTFGIGAQHGIGEEFVLLADALRAGLKGQYFPITLGHHPDDSTGANWHDLDLLRARIALLSRVFGRTAPLWRFAFALKHRHRLRQQPGIFWRFIKGTL